MLLLCVIMFTLLFVVCLLVFLSFSLSDYLCAYMHVDIALLMCLFMLSCYYLCVFPFGFFMFSVLFACNDVVVLLLFAFVCVSMCVDVDMSLCYVLCCV